MEFFDRIKNYFYENRHFFIASTLSTIGIVVLFFVLSLFKGNGKTSYSTDNLYSSSETTSQTKENTTTGELSDINFSLPEDSTEETQELLPSGEYPYLIKVNRAMNCVTVYIQDDDGNYTVPYKAMVCSTGKIASYTPTGNFSISSRYVWRLMVDGTYAQYATRFNNGILFPSVPYFVEKKNQLETEEYNKLGSPASLG